MNVKNVKNGALPVNMYIFIIIVILIIILIRVSLSDKLTVKHYEFETPYVTKEHVFALITDLHSTIYGTGQSELTDKIAHEQPEAVFFSGDIADDKRGFDGAEALFSSLVGLYPCYYVTGNHERWIEYTDDIKSLISSCGVRVICGECVELGDGIRLFGVDDPTFYTKNNSDDGFFDTLKAFDTSGDFFDILLSHRPEFIEKYAESGFELSLTGHAHGGQARIPFLLNGLYAPNQGWFPKYAGGQYFIGNGYAVVSRGLMRDSLPRIFNPPELVIIKIVPSK